MDSLLGDEQRELRFLIAEHCHDIIPPLPDASSSASDRDAQSHRQQQQELSHAIAIVLAYANWMPLVDIMAALTDCRFSTMVPRGMLTPEHLRAEVKRLLFHGVLRFDARTQRYALDLCFGALRILFPFMAQHVITQLGAVAEAALQTVYEHHDLPLSLLTNTITDRLPAVGHGAVDDVIKTLAADQWLIHVATTGSGAAPSSSSHAAPATAGGGAAAAAASPPLSPTQTHATQHHSFGINYAKFVAHYRSQVLFKYVADNLDANQLDVINFLAQRIPNSAPFQQTTVAQNNYSVADSLPADSIDVVETNIRIPRSGADISLIVRSLVLDATHYPLVKESRTAVGTPTPKPAAKKAKKARGKKSEAELFDDLDKTFDNNDDDDDDDDDEENAQNMPLDALAGVSGSSPQYIVASCRLSFTNAVFRARRALICAECRARFGFAGQRVARILMDARALEDKSIAEESLIQLTDLHTLLLQMQQFGLVSIQELLRPASGHNMSLPNHIQANSGPDRTVKNSIFLWRWNERAALSLVRRRVCKSICAVRTRLRSEYHQLVGAAAAAASSSMRGGGGGRDDLAPAAPPNTAGSDAGVDDEQQQQQQAGTRNRGGVSAANQQRFTLIHEHLSKSLSSLYEELALAIFF